VPKSKGGLPCPEAYESPTETTNRSVTRTGSSLIIENGSALVGTVVVSRTRSSASRGNAWVNRHASGPKATNGPPAVATSQRKPLPSRSAGPPRQVKRTWRSAGAMSGDEGFVVTNRRFGLDSREWVLSTMFQAKPPSWARVLTRNVASPSRPSPSWAMP
jgi:hypothetical protein